MNDLLDELTLDDLSGDQYDLAECVGIETYIKLVRTYAGSPINIPMPGTITKKIRNRKINEEFDGNNCDKIARKYTLSERSIRVITAEKKKELNEKPLDGQLKLF